MARGQRLMETAGVESGLDPVYVCSRCGTQDSAETAIWHCSNCGGLLEGWPAVTFSARDVDDQETGLWRYARALPPLPASERVRLGEVMTPLVESEPLAAMLKVDYLFPSGSYKDRGGAVLVSRLRHLGVRQALEDSSGNAGASIAAYSAAAGISCEVFVPAGNSPDKLAQIEAYGRHCGRSTVTALRSRGRRSRPRKRASTPATIGTPTFTRAYRVWVSRSGSSAAGARPTR